MNRDDATKVKQRRSEAAQRRQVYGSSFSAKLIVNPQEIMTKV